MSFAARLLTNFPLVNILFSVVLIMGTLAFVQMPREQDPEINFNWVNIATTLPGASAEDVERLVTSPLEDALRNVQDVRWVTSSSRESASNILIRFRDIGQAVFDKRMNDLRREVQNASETELPAEWLSHSPGCRHGSGRRRTAVAHRASRERRFGSH